MEKNRSESLHIVHYFDLERYPPILNLIDYIGTVHPDLDTVVYSTKPPNAFKNKLKSIKYRLFGSDNTGSKFSPISYVFFTLKTLFHLIVDRPSTVLYYESISAVAPVLYKFIFRKAKIYVHYHEYIPKKEYLNQKWFWVVFYKMEVFSFKKYQGISHTNAQRCNLFLEDHKEIDGLEEIQNIYPNYPPKAWSKVVRQEVQQVKILKVIYVGYSLNEKTSYISEFVQWLSGATVKSHLDIYCHKPSNLFKAGKNRFGNVTVCEELAISYSNLPRKLVNYDVGLILYRGHTQNYIYNAPNKLFEYLACGLDVWFPDVMEGPKKYQSNQKPKVLSLDFTNLTQYTVEDLIQGDSTETKNNSEYFSESIYQEMLKDILC